MASAVDSRLAYARLSAVATASRLPTANRGSNNSYTTSWDTTRGNALFAAQTLKDDPDLLFRRILLARPAPNILHNPLSGLFGSHGFLSHLRSLRSLR